jgi:uncharacterized lipoprotein YmbA
MRRARVSLALLAFCVASACVLKHTVPARTYVLDAMAVQGTVPNAADAPLSVVGVLRVAVPAWQDRPEITARAAGGEIASDEYARWGEPIARGIQRVVVDNLAALLPDRHVVAEPFAARQRVDHRVEITVTEIARQADGSVLLEARWGILGPDGVVVRQHRSSHRAMKPVGTAGTVAGASEALAGLCREIAEAVRELPAAVAAPAK